MNRKGGRGPLESTDGKTLFYLNPKDSGVEELWKVPVEGGEELRVLEKVLLWNFQVQEHAIYYISQPGPTRTPFLLYDFASRKIETIALIQNPVGIGFTVSPDEQEILYMQGGGARSDLMLVENFR